MSCQPNFHQFKMIFKQQGEELALGQTPLWGWQQAQLWVPEDQGKAGTQARL
jgi:hypothetical protein